MNTLERWLQRICLTLGAIITAIVSFSIGFGTGLVGVGLMVGLYGFEPVMSTFRQAQLVLWYGVVWLSGLLV